MRSLTTCLIAILLATTAMGAPLPPPYNPLFPTRSISTPKISPVDTAAIAFTDVNNKREISVRQVFRENDGAEEKLEEENEKGKRQLGAGRYAWYRKYGSYGNYLFPPDREGGEGTEGRDGGEVEGGGSGMAEGGYGGEGGE